ncbi:ABC transporter ATP-binding protein [Nitriliruptor alkaliphilus]|uniref:ABC transporter ATP-binding protein n=1 Tax=Nitriliruptor alkaliphilus TaxID=427918 RepID=UPI0006985910|nr:ATP-binding cassette domain-containing protein [Nitriliruptor alkaliphilus]
MLETRDLTVFFENAIALNKVSIRVDAGEVVGLFGPNSAGKSTLVKSLAGLTQHQRFREKRRKGERITITGSVWFEGQDITELPVTKRVDRGLVLCRERHPVFKDNNVEENLRAGGHLRTRQETAEGIERAISMFPPLDALRRRRAGLMSGGEQQMLAIGMALVVRPSLLLLDEPLLGLSPAMQQAVVSAIRRIHDDGVTVVVTEQYARPLLPVVDRAYVLENGTVNVSGTRDELVESPEFAAAYFGAT